MSKEKENQPIVKPIEYNNAPKVTLDGVLRAHKQRKKVDPVNNGKLTFDGFLNWVNEESMKGNNSGTLPAELMTEELLENIEQLVGIIVKEKFRKVKSCLGIKPKTKEFDERYKFTWGSKQRKITL